MFERGNPYGRVDQNGHWAITVGVSGDSGGAIGGGVGVGGTISYSKEQGPFVGIVEDYGGGAYGGAIIDANAVDIMFYPDAKSSMDLEGLGFSYSGQAYCELGGGFTVEHDIEGEFDEQSTLTDVIKGIGKKPIGYGAHAGVGFGASANTEIKNTNVQGVFVRQEVAKAKNVAYKIGKKSSDFFIEAHKRATDFANSLKKAYADYQKKYSKNTKK